jgi:hypothetical protein
MCSSLDDTPMTCGLQGRIDPAGSLRNTCRLVGKAPVCTVDDCVDGVLNADDSEAVVVVVSDGTT